MTKIKICGLTRPEDAGYLNEFLPDYAGFVFAAKSRRYISPDTALRLRELLDRRIQTVGVFVDERPDTVLETAASGAINAIQLHGDEDACEILYYKEKTRLPVIKAFSIKNEDDIKKACMSGADLTLLDNGAGGTGETFDWELLKQFKKPYFLAGGLSPDNVRNVVTRFSPYAVDVSSGVETDGVKDREKIRLFIENVRKEQK